MAPMAKAPEGIASTPLSAGWAQLADGEWAAAKASFADALAHEETPEALEGLSWAAWWLDDAEAVFDARQRAYRLYRRRGESASAARMATWLAADQLDFRGAVAVAGGWLRRAERLLAPLEPGPEHGWLAFHDGYIAFLSGDTMRADELGARAAEVGRQFDVPDLEMLGRAPGSGPGRRRAGPGGHASPGRGDRDGPGGRGDDPDLERLGLLFPRQRLHSRSRLRARI
jgi:hypothetical protein